MAALTASGYSAMTMSPAAGVARDPFQANGHPMAVAAKDGSRDGEMGELPGEVSAVPTDAVAGIGRGAAMAAGCGGWRGACRWRCFVKRDTLCPQRP